MAINVNIPKPTYTTAEVADSVDARYVTDAELTVIQNTSGTNTGDQDLSGYVPYTGATASVDLNTNDLIFGAGAGVLLNIASRLREGTIDAGTGGTKGIAQICAVGYELKWEAGSQYVMDGNGVLVRIVNYKFNIAPTVNNDDTEGFYVGSRWILDDGTIYTCSDSTTGAAVWDLNSGFVPYTGATANVDLGTFNLEATTLVKTGGLATEFLMADGTTSLADIIFTIELVDALTIDFYAPYNLKINTVTNVFNAPTTTILDDGVAYTLTNTIAVGSIITVTVDTAAVVNLNIVKV